MNNLQLKTIKITDLKPHPKNPRIHPESAINKLVASIQEYGWTNPVLISKDGYILAGHARLKAAEKAGLKEVPCIELPLSGTKALAYLIADNRLHEDTAWDYPSLGSLFAELKELNYDETKIGFDKEELEQFNYKSNFEHEIRYENLKPFKKAHWLISIDIDNFEALKKIQTFIDRIANNEGVEIEQASN